MFFSWDLLTEALLFGVLLGCFYAAVSIGLSVSFGLLDVPYVAHPAVMVLGSYCTFIVAGWGVDPILAGLALMVPFFFLGVLIYRFYYEAFEKRGADAGVRGLAFFFGFAFIIEVGLILVFGVDQRLVQAGYIGSSLELPGDYRVPYRMLVAFGVALLLTFALSVYLSKTFTGRAIKAVAQDQAALRLMAANPVRIKQWAFGIATAVSALAGAMLIIVGPVEPAMDREYIGRTFCVVVLAGLGSMTGTLAAGLILGIVEQIVLIFFGASWAPAVAFGLLLVVLGIRPQGLFGR
ncbi:MAG TPA: branched-chain amino acid ABC transporter permease [Burkholderiales bacterium]|jgi:branched-chain amino acid transport system permease protein|nr:branched-chain amino acid ABC transporter permease [Burkholderiales bacterium]